MSIEPKKIALFLYHLGGGGAERMMINLARGFVDRGAKVDMVLICKEGDYLSLVPPSVQIVDLKAGRTLHSIRPLAKYLQRERPDALMSTLVFANVAAVLARHIARVPVRLFVREANHVSIDRVRHKRLLQLFADRLQPQAYRWADGVIAVSAGVAEDMIHCLGLPAEHISIINNPVVTGGLPLLAAEPVAHPWFATGQPPVIMGVGRLTTQKDFPTLIRAFARIRQKRRVRLAILGEGEDRPMLENLCDELGIRDSVALLGFVLNPYSYVARAGVVVLSSRWEGSPNVLVEAMACGTPVVSTDCPSGPRETLKNGRYGMLVPVGDVNTLADSIMQTLNDPVDAKILKQRADDFSVDRAADEYLRVLLGD